MLESFGAAVRAGADRVIEAETTIKASTAVTAGRREHAAGASFDGPRTVEHAEELLTICRSCGSTTWCRDEAEAPLLSKARRRGRTSRRWSKSCPGPTLPAGQRSSAHAAPRTSGADQRLATHRLRASPTSPRARRQQPAPLVCFDACGDTERADCGRILDACLSAELITAGAASASTRSTCGCSARPASSVQRLRCALTRARRPARSMIPTPLAEIAAPIASTRSAAALADASDQAAERPDHDEGGGGALSRPPRRRALVRVRGERHEAGSGRDSGATRGWTRAPGSPSSPTTPANFTACWRRFRWPRRGAGAAGQMLALDRPLEARTARRSAAYVASADCGPLRHRYSAARPRSGRDRLPLRRRRWRRCGERFVENIAGYDLAKLFAGSFGTLGLIAQVALRLPPRPEASVTASGWTSNNRWPVRRGRRAGGAAAAKRTRSTSPSSNGMGVLLAGRLSGARPHASGRHSQDNALERVEIVNDPLWQQRERQALDQRSC